MPKVITASPPESFTGARQLPGATRASARRASLLGLPGFLRWHVIVRDAGVVFSLRIARAGLVEENLVLGYPALGVPALLALRFGRRLLVAVPIVWRSRTYPEFVRNVASLLRVIPKGDAEVKAARLWSASTAASWNRAVCGNAKRTN